MWLTNPVSHLLDRCCSHGNFPREKRKQNTSSNILHGQVKSSAEFPCQKTTLLLLRYPWSLMWSYNAPVYWGEIWEQASTLPCCHHRACQLVPYCGYASVCTYKYIFYSCEGEAIVESSHRTSFRRTLKMVNVSEENRRKPDKTGEKVTVYFVRKLQVKNIYIYIYL